MPERPHCGILENHLPWMAGPRGGVNRDRAVWRIVRSPGISAAMSRRACDR